MSTLQLVAVVGIITWAIVKAPAIRHFVLGIRTAIAFGTKPRELFERLRKEGVAAVPFAPVLGNRTHLLVDKTSIAKLYALPSSVCRRAPGCADRPGPRLQRVLLPAGLRQ